MPHVKTYRMRTRKVFTNGWLFWLARHSQLGVVLLDESNQHGVVEGRLRAYVLASDAIEEFDRSEFRSALTGEVTDAEFVEIANRYNQFKTAVNLPLKAPVDVAHRNFLRKRGLPEQQLRARQSAKRSRATHCYSCRTKLDNSIDVECSQCGWIICVCGACGCGWVRRNEP